MDLTKKYDRYINKNDFLRYLDELSNIDGIIHLGACSSTVEEDFDYLYQNNFDYSVTLYNYCARKNIPFLYSSSAAVYGNGTLGFYENIDNYRLEPLNRYGYSKLLFDRWMVKQTKKPRQVVGLRFFNVYGPNEYHKGSMASMVYHGFNQVQSEKKIRLFKSENPQYKDGGQLRDFVYVKDICDVICFFWTIHTLTEFLMLDRANAILLKNLL